MVNMDLGESWEKVKKTREFNEFYFFAIALILAFGTLQTAGTVTGTDKPVVTVVSCSMYPHYDVGDIIVVQGKDFDRVEEGDIVVYDSGASDMSIPVIHRVLDKKPDYLETKGDNNNAQLEFEKRVEPEQVHGVAVFSVPRIGLVKLVTLDVFGLTGPGDRPLAIDQIPECHVRV